MDLTGNMVAMLLGVGSSATLHISQVLMRLGVVDLRAGNRSLSRWALYLTGLLLNFSAPFWVMAANLFADTLWFTSMFATGLVTLLLFSRLVLGEVITRAQTLGAGLIVAGTLLIAAAGLTGAPGRTDMLNLPLLLAVSLSWVLLMPVLGMLCRHRQLRVQETIFGLAAGGFLALDALWKSLSQQRLDGGVGLLPVSLDAWLFLGVSFVGALGAFLMMQWSYWRHCRPVGVLVSYNLMYVSLPLALAGVMALRHGVAQLDVLILSGLLLMLAGGLISQSRMALQCGKD